MKIISINNKKTVTLKAQLLLDKILEDNKDKSILLLLSGGSSLELVKKISPKNLSSSTTISMIDERFSRDPKISNFAQLSQTIFYQQAQKNKCSFIDTRPKRGENLPALARRLNKEFNNWKHTHSEGVVVAVLGIGEDGHTAGIMPFPESKSEFEKLFLNEDIWVTGYDAKEKNRYALRVTSTLEFINNIVDISVIYAVGNKKHDIVKNIIKQTESIESLPASALNKLSRATLLTDTPI